MTTDSQLQNDVMPELKWDYEVPTEKVIVKDGWGTPEDTVDEQSQRDVAVRCALRAVFSRRHNWRQYDYYQADDERERCQKCA